jgi:hypothetical protein
MASIYLLIDPRTAEVRYVGWAKKCLNVRLRAHLNEARGGVETYKNRWVRSLIASHLRPTIWLIETTTDYHTRERYWIAHYRAAGCRLTNATDGGEGALGRKHSTEAKARMAAFARQRPPMSEAVRARMSAAGKGRPKSEEHRQKIGAAHKGRPKFWLRKIKPPGPGQLRGEDAPGAKLTWEQVRALRAEPWPQPYKNLVEKYGIQECQLVKILRGTDWRDPDYAPRPRQEPLSAERHPHAKLTWEKVRAIRSEPKGQPLQILAEKYEVCRASICLVLNNKQWKEPNP